MTPRGVGPFDQDTVATKAALQKLVPKLRVVEHELGGDSGIVYDVFERDHQLLYVVPDDAPGWTEDAGVEHEYSRTVFAVFAVSPRVSVLGRPWRVGEAFDDARGLDTCECWGEREVTACFRPGSHVRVIFELPCDEAEAQGPKAMLGKPIARIMWKRVVETPELSPSE